MRPPEMGIDPDKRYTATMSTSMGDMVIALDPVNGAQDRQQLRVPRPAPLLRRRHLPPHHQRLRVPGRRPDRHRPRRPRLPVRGRAAQAGQYEIGSVAMANAGPNTNGSQFFLICGPSGVSLPPQYSLFGKIVKGLDVLDAMQRVADRSRRPAARRRRHQLGHDHRRRLTTTRRLADGVHAETDCSLSNAQARRIALGAQGFADPRPTGRVDRRHLRRVLDRIGLIQIDSVNVLVRSQELPLFARLGPHPRTLIADATRRRRAVRVLGARGLPRADRRTTTCYRWTDARAAPLAGVPTLMAERARLHRGGLRARRRQRPGRRRRPQAAGRQEGHVVGLGRRQDRARGAVLRRPCHAPAGGRSDFARVYDLTERVIPADVLARAGAARARGAQGAARAGRQAPRRRHARATSPTTTAMKPPVCRPLVAELVEEGRLRRGRGRGMEAAGVHAPRRRSCRGGSTARALLSPFDPVVWNRDRAERLFGFHYRIEIYTPPPKRQYGYYVLPFLLGDELVGRVDLKADRANEHAAGAERRGVSRASQRARSPASCSPNCVDGGLARARARRGHGRGDLGPALVALTN